MAITASFEHIKTGRCTSFGYGSGGKGAAPAVPTNPKLRARWLVTQAIQHDSDHHNFVARKRQLDGSNCSWLHKVLPKTDQRLEEYIGDVPSNFSFGHHVSAVIDVDGIPIALGGAVDIVQSPLNGGRLILHEVEFTSPLSRETFLQIAIYGYLWAITHGMNELPPMKVLNIHDGAAWEIESTMDSVKEIIRDLAKAKYGYGNKKNDQEFIAECEDVKGKYAELCMVFSRRNHEALLKSEPDGTSSCTLTRIRRSHRPASRITVHPSIPTNPLLIRSLSVSNQERLIISGPARRKQRSRQPDSKQAQSIIELNPEQKAIILYSEQYNVSVCAVPGSGKTTVALEIMMRNTQGKTLVKTYSKLLQLETEKKAEESGMPESSNVFTIHAFAGKVAGEIINNDEKLQQFLDYIHSFLLTPQCELDFDQIIIDEAQDLKPEYYRFILSIVDMIKKMTGCAPRLVVKGDARQAIRDYDGGDSRFLTFAETIFRNVSPYPWKHQEMFQTHRFNPASAELVNIQCDPTLASPGIRGSLLRSQNRPILVPVDSVRESKKLARVLIGIINQYGPHNTAILAPSQKSGTPLTGLANALAKYHGIPIAGLPDDDAELTIKTMEGKLAISTYHKFKGRERDLVIVMGVDGSWYQHYGPRHSDDTMSNEHYVALTRHREQLVILHDIGRTLPPNLTPDAVHSICEIVNPEDIPLDLKPYVRRPPKTGLRFPRKGESVKGFLRHIRSEDLVFVEKKYLRIQQTTQPLPEGERLRIGAEYFTGKVGKFRHHEPVSDLTGVAITAAFEYEMTGRCRTLSLPGELEREPTVPSDPQSRTIWFAKRALTHHRERQNFLPRAYQMSKSRCNWLQGHLDVTNQRLREYIGGNIELSFERGVRGSVAVDGQTLALSGSIDILQEGNHPVIHEIKSVAALSIEHRVQVAIYGYLWARENRTEIPVLSVFNVLTGESYKVESTVKEMESLIQYLAICKYGPRKKPSDEEFLAACDKIQKSIDVKINTARGTRPMQVKTTRVPLHKNFA
ncbi:hypothetical protein FRC17_006454 [Serendipita sp. 399]|nr:hypothetical protein FRC17_006454 [Serendipita sp. 399]